ncbi:hypothetical protein [Marinifilum flexuosum]|uniref:hypothetical protein n=1 Tax=Marinifilum flexuosum TaxID=1117708 RepID=UPI0024948965|nr:hypothetical protein [Marinifilum flexuosum]
MKSFIDICKKVDWNKVSAILQAIVGVITIAFVLYTYNTANELRIEYLKNHTKSKQIEVVCDLVEKLNSSRIKIEAVRFEKGTAYGQSRTLLYNIFEIGDLLKPGKKGVFNVDIDFKEYDDFKVLFDSQSNQIWELKEFINNPFLPKEIADELISFYSIRCVLKDRKELEDSRAKIIVLKSKCFEMGKISEKIEYPDFIEGSAIALESWLQLKSYSLKLTHTISYWFKKNGIDDINLRIDYKN